MITAYAIVFAALLVTAGQAADRLGRRVQVVHNGCGRVAAAVMVCSAYGEHLGPRDVQAVPGPGPADDLLTAAPATAPLSVRAARARPAAP